MVGHDFTVLSQLIAELAVHGLKSLLDYKQLDSNSKMLKWLRCPYSMLNEGFELLLALEPAKNNLTVRSVENVGCVVQ